MRRLILASIGSTAFTLAGCAQTPPPAIEVRTERVEVPVPVACIKASDVPAVPTQVGDKLTGNAVVLISGQQIVSVPFPSFETAFTCQPGSSFVRPWPSLVASVFGHRA